MIKQKRFLPRQRQATRYVALQFLTHEHKVASRVSHSRWQDRERRRPSRARRRPPAPPERLRHPARTRIFEFEVVVVALLLLLPLIMVIATNEGTHRNKTTEEVM